MNIDELIRCVNRMKSHVIVGCFKDMRINESLFPLELFILYGSLIDMYLFGYIRSFALGERTGDLMNI